MPTSSQSSFRRWLPGQAAEQPELVPSQNSPHQKTPPGAARQSKQVSRRQNSTPNDHRNRASAACSMSVYELKPTMLSCRHPSQNRFCSARTNDEVFTARSAACGGERVSGPASTRTAATCHSWPRAACATAPQSVSRRAHASACPRVWPMHATAPTSSGLRARLCPKQPQQGPCLTVTSWGRVRRRLQNTPSVRRALRAAVCYNIVAQRSSALCAAQAGRALLARRIRARRRKASRRKRARRGHPGVVARWRHCAHGEGASAQPSGRTQHQRVHTSWNEPRRRHARSEARRGHCEELLTRQLARKSTQVQVHALPGGGMKGGGGMPIGGRMPGGMPGPPICGGAEICATRDSGVRTRSPTSVAPRTKL